MTHDAALCVAVAPLPGACRTWTLPATTATRINADPVLHRCSSRGLDRLPRHQLAWEHCGAPQGLRCFWGVQGFRRQDHSNNVEFRSDGHQCWPVCLLTATRS
jgi:hypothetical protein